MTERERVARAICREWLAEQGEAMLREGVMSASNALLLAFATVEAVDEHWRDFERQAGAAIAAMREGR